MNPAFVGYEELSRSRRVLSTSADNILLKNIFAFMIYNKYSFTSFKQRLAAEFHGGKIHYL